MAITPLLTPQKRKQILFASLVFARSSATVHNSLQSRQKSKNNLEYSTQKYTINKRLLNIEDKKLMNL